MGKKMLLWVAVLSLALFPRTEHADAAFWFQSKRATVDLRLLETSDLHGYMLNYDYAARTEAETYGLALTASLIAAERKAAKNTMLFDDGDLLEGNEMAAYVARRPLKKGEIHPFIRVMNHLNYDAATVGNHDFHYGLDFLKQTINGAKFPFVNANIYYNFEKNDTDDQNFFKPYVILDKKVEDRSGHHHHLKIGVIGFVTPSVIEWEKPSLGGKVKAKDILHTAAWFVPRMKAEGADLIIALAHCGVDPAVKQPFYTGDAVYLLSEVKGIDAILFGHQHRVFPSEFFAGVPGVDIRKGTINGVPAVMPGKWGSHLGVISLTLEKKGEKWEMTQAQSEAKPVYAIHNQQAKSIVRPDPDIVRMTAELQKNVLGSKFTLYSRN